MNQLHMVCLGPGSRWRSTALSMFSHDAHSQSRALAVEGDNCIQQWQRSAAKVQPSHYLQGTANCFNALCSAFRRTTQRFWSTTSCLHRPTCQLCSLGNVNVEVVQHRQLVRSRRGSVSLTRQGGSHFSHSAVRYPFISGGCPVMLAQPPPSSVAMQNLRRQALGTQPLSALWHRVRWLPQDWGW